MKILMVFGVCSLIILATAADDDQLEGIELCM